MLEKIIQNTFAKVTATVVAASILQGCIIRQTYNWKSESVVDTRYEEVREEIRNETQYEITARLSDNGTLNIDIDQEEYTINYDILQPIQIQQQRKYSYGKSKVGEVITNVGLGTTFLGLMFTFDAEGTPASSALLVSGIITFIMGEFIWSMPKKERETQEYRTVEVPLETTETRRSGEILNTISASNIPFTVSSDYFTSYEDPRLGTASGLHTDSQGNATVQLIPTDPGFAFTQEGITNVVYAQQLRKAGFSSRKYLPLLQQNAAPVQYTVTIQTQATDGENAKLDVPVKGWTVASEAMDQIIMGL